jgi:hypothetical protein
MNWQQFKQEYTRITATFSKEWRAEEHKSKAQCIALARAFRNEADGDLERERRNLLLYEAAFPAHWTHLRKGGHPELLERAEQEVTDEYVNAWIAKRKAANKKQKEKNLKYKGRLVNFAAVPNELVDLGLKPRELALWLVLKVYTYSGKESCFPGRATLAKKMGVGLVTVSKAIKGLEQKHLLKTKRRYMGQPNIYTLLDPKLARIEAKNGSKSG